MRKTTKGNKEKIPRLTEAEYAEYIALLKTSDDIVKEGGTEGETSAVELPNDMHSVTEKPR